MLPGGPPSSPPLRPRLRFETCCSRRVLARHEQVAHAEISPPRDAGRQTAPSLCTLDPRSSASGTPATPPRRVPPARKSLRTGPQPGFPVPPQPCCPLGRGPRACCTRAPRPQPTPARQAAAGHWARADGAQAAGARAGLTQPPEGRGVTGRGLTLAGRRWRLLRARARLAAAPRRLPEGDRGAGRGGASAHSLPAAMFPLRRERARTPAGAGGGSGERRG